MQGNHYVSLKPTPQNFYISSSHQYLMSGDMINRCPTGIPGFDQICQGGLVRDSDNVILGGPGSGKTTFILQFLWNGVTKYNENGLYCSFEPDIIEILKDAQSYGWDFAKLNEQNRVKFLKFSPETSIQELKSELTRIISKYSISRVCFDPVSVLALSLNEEGKIRQTIFELVSLMKRLKVTSLLIDESINPQGNSIESTWTKTDLIKFLSDSVITFYEGGIPGISDRALRINKMRRTNHIRTPVGMKITPHGMEVLPTQ